MGPADVLRAFADLAPTGDRAAPLDITVHGSVAWLGTDVVPVPATDDARADEPVGTVGRNAVVDRLAAVDALHRDERILRVGWVLYRGVMVDGDRRREVRLPAVAVPARLVAAGRSRTGVVLAGDLELLPEIADAGVAVRLEAAVEFGGGAGDFDLGRNQAPVALADRARLEAWARDVAVAAGLPVVEVRVAADDEDPTERVVAPLGYTDDESWVVAYIGAVLYAARDPQPVDVAGTLRTLAAVPGLEHTALAAAYGLVPPVPSPPDGFGPVAVASPLPLSPPQREIVARARHEPLVVVSGPPGSGKSHVVAAVAIDAVAHGASVLLATRSPHAADVLGGLLARYPGPTPVLFGDAEDRAAIRRELAGGLDRGTVALDLRDLEAGAVRATAAVVDIEAIAGATLAREVRAARAERWDPLIGELAHAAPGIFTPTADLAAAEALAARFEASGSVVDPGWFARRRLRAAERRWRDALGAAPEVGHGELRRALEAALDRRAAAELASRGGTTLAPRLDELLVADAALAAALGALVDGRSRAESRRSAGGRAAAVALGAALRAGRRTRRQLLAGLDGPALVGALPLWVGTLRDVDDLLPPTPGLFDLVVLDEASQIDQPSAAGALVRAKRAVVVGDPRQLRHVSFLADLDVNATLARHDLAPMADRLDLRRSSLYDVAAAGAPVTWLDEHYRSVPHLIGFSARQFYDDRLRIATRHPATEAVDAIDYIRCAPGADADAAVDAVSAIADAGGRDIGVVAPFRALADEIEALLLARFTPSEVVALGLRAGTAHAFQGAEHEHIVLAVGLDADGPANRRRFVEDPNLLNVLLTRARRHLVVVTSLPPPADPDRPSGLLEAFLAIADRPPAPHPGGEAATPWVAALATELRRAGVEVRWAYPVGRWTVDLCAGAGASAAALDCAVHPDGPAAHLARHRALRRAGWRTLDAWPTCWDGDVARAALDLAPLLR